jgi:peroxiredoxin
MQRRAFVGILLSIPLLTGFQDKVYDFSLKNVDQKTFYLSELQGDRLTVIDFWATWCQPCIRSLPKMVEMSREFESRGVRFVGISVDSPRNISEVKPFARSLGITYPVLLDLSGELMGDLNILAVPTLMIVDPDLNILYTHEGFNAGDEEEIRGEIEQHLAAGR